MNIQSSQNATLPLRPLPKPDRAQTHLGTMEQDTRDQQIESCRGIERPVEGQRTLLSTTNGDVNDWILVQRHDVPSSSVPTSSETTSNKGAGPELTATNIQLFDELYKSSTCSSGDRHLCYRRPECLDDVVEKHGSPARRCSIGSGELLGPWAPMNAGSYESDVRCIGDWATSATGDVYTGLIWDF
ncbi:Uncharacterized protein TCAP_07334 [Tolypocladium capitatum]|uniref:Uncharacterized protein n=1 Tax=Tolypocladium capitatum TaxID=45235 RepID=A0A2K3PZG8_9HYPO|nr:Uncharacterized protein TCAP_07334 [Tolypocladium capitatum]